MASQLAGLVTKAIAQAETEHNPAAELQELSELLQFQVNRVIALRVRMEMYPEDVDVIKDALYRAIDSV